MDLFVCLFVCFTNVVTLGKMLFWVLAQREILCGWGGGIKGKTPSGKHADVCVSARKGEESAWVNSAVTGAV